MTNVPNLRFKEFSEEWISSKLDDVSTQIGDGIHATPGYVDISEISFINGNNIKDHKIIINENTKCISEEELKKYKVNLNNNSILMSINGTIGNIGYYNNEKVLLGKSVAYININPNIINKFFLGSLLETDKVQRKFMSELTGTTIKNLSLKSIRDCKLNVPSIVEQEKIGSFFSLIDKKIELQTEKVEELKNYKKGIMQKIFSQELRFKDENGNEYPEWEERKVKDIFDVTRGVVIAKSEISDENNDMYKYPVYSSQTSNNGILGYDQTFDFEGNYLTWTTDGANAGRVFGRSGKFRCTNVCGVLVEKDITKGYANKLLVEILNRETPKYVSYVGNPKLMNGVMSEIKIKLPILKEQVKVSKLIEQLDTKIEKEQEKLECLNQYKKGLLQQMFI